MSFFLILFLISLINSHPFRCREPSSSLTPCPPNHVRHTPAIWSCFSKFFFALVHILPHNSSWDRGMEVVIIREGKVALKGGVHQFSSSRDSWRYVLMRKSQITRFRASGGNCLNLSNDEKEVATKGINLGVTKATLDLFAATFCRIWQS